MRYFNNSDLTAAMPDILSESFNLEAGKIYYKKNVLITDKPESYPSFTVDGVKTTIKTNMGFIFLPERIMTDFVKSFKAGICSMGENFKQKMNFDHLQGYSTLETGNDHFTAFKAKHMMEGITTSEYHYENVKRKIYVNEKNAKLEKVIGNARFTWVLYSIEQFISDLASYEFRSIPISCQLVGIFYDPAKLLSLKDGSLQISNITFKHFEICKNILYICSYGKITPEFLKKYAENAELKTLLDDIQFCQKIPEYLPGWTTQAGETSLMLCEKRKGAFEIIKRLGNKNVYGTNTHIPISPINQMVYDIDLKDIVINQDVCFNCETPLYDDIYVIFEDKNSNIGKPVCSICLHSKFDLTSHRFLPVSGDYLYAENHVIGRTKYPRTVKQVINMIETDETVKDILLQTFASMYVDLFHSSICVMYLNFEYNKISTQKNVKYLGWNSTVNQFISYVNGDSYDSNIFSKFSTRQAAIKYIQSCNVFPYINVTY